MPDVYRVTFEKSPSGPSVRERHYWGVRLLNDNGSELSDSELTKKLSERVPTCSWVYPGATSITLSMGFRDSSRGLSGKVDQVERGVPVDQDGHPVPDKQGYAGLFHNMTAGGARILIDPTSDGEVHIKATGFNKKRRNIDSVECTVKPGDANKTVREIRGWGF